MISGERQMERIRTLYFRSLLSHDVTWYDVNNTKALAASFTSDMDSLADGISQKLITSLQRIVVWLTCNICALVMEWRLGLSLLAFLPLNILIAIVMSKVGGKAANREQEEYSTAGGIAEEVIGAIRTVLAFNGQENECKRYRSNLGKAEKYLVIKGVATGFGANLFAFVFSCIASVCVYYGIELFITDNIEPGNMIGVFILASAGSLSLVTASQNSQFVAEAREVAQRVYPIIDRHARRDVTGKSGIIPKHVEGRLEIKNVSFAYPARPEVQVIKDVNFTVAPGRTIALVGNSGCGKSTIVQLLEKFYTPQQGEITLDGINIAHLNTEWLRRQIGFVGQEPVLLSTSISENIRIGNTSATDEDIIRAATIANADGFIKQLPKGYDTYVGESGCQLSGGQKQRIAIARALVRDPSILLLDEATSALDLAGEVIVQKAIDKAKQGRTTVLIAHRLSTVIGADIIFVINDGQIVEQGTHTELLQKDGYYRKLVNSQIGLAVDSEELEEMDTLSMENKVEDLKEKENTDVTETKIKQKKKKSTSLKVLKLMAPEKCLVIIGMILTMIGSFAFPVLPFIVSEALTLFQKSPEEARAIGRELVAILMSVAVCAFIVRIAGTVILQKTAAKLTTRIRDTLFTAFMYKDVEYFDREENRVGLLTTRLSSDAIAIHGVSAVKLSNNLDGTVAIIIALGAALYVNWKLCLLLLILLPFNFIASNFLGRISNSKRETNTQGSLEITGQIVQEAMSNIRLVFSFSSEATLLRKFQEAAADLRRKTVRTNLAPCIIAPLLDANLFFLVAIALTYGSFIVQYENIEFHQIIRVFMLLNQISIGIGRYSSLSPDFIKARSAADRIFAVIENQSQINVKGKQGRSLPEFQGNLKFNKVSFQYASSGVASHVLHDVTLDVTSGMKLALVGPSGCGKTTTVSLIHRLYDVTSGCVLADGHDIRELDVSWLRSQMGLVSQEPVLFDRTIAENIQYGDNSREVPLSDVIEVSRMANLHEFVTSLPQGYDTHCGHKGTLLSGGEKQRVAIARALVRKPKLLLLDEATSALDSHNEKIVQEAIERASQGRTTIVIAHRLSTIQDCDHIAVFRHGTIVEAGTHQELIAAKGDYYRLLQAQQS